jgi:peptidoglycan/LPS O-acetylase OafA/YrhL
LQVVIKAQSKVSRELMLSATQESVSRNTSNAPRYYRPELDALRFVAFLMVFIRHLVHTHNAGANLIFSSGQSGVCLFFMLSAYLITELLEREESQTNRIDLRAFYIRRILRIWPLYFAALLLARLIDFHPPHLQMSNGRLLASVLLVGNWYVVKYGLPASFALVLWSIPVEEQFYLMWPSIRKFLGHRALFFVSLLTFPISYLSIAWLCRHHAFHLQLWVNTLVQAQFFGLGGMLALRLKGYTPRWPLWLRCLLFLGGIAAFSSSEYFFYGNAAQPLISTAIPEFLLMDIGASLFFFSMLGFSELRHARFLIYLGKISYGLYVFHLLASRITQRPLRWIDMHAHLPHFLQEPLELVTTLSLAILMAHLSYRYYESAFLRLKERFTVVRSRSV